MTNLIRADRNMQLKAEWEHKTENIIVKNTVQSRISEIRRQAEENIEVRRQRLAALYN